jgi:hypothetical protein
MQVMFQDQEDMVDKTYNPSSSKNDKVKRLVDSVPNMFVKNRPKPSMR